MELKILHIIIIYRQLNIWRKNCLKRKIIYSDYIKII